MSEVEPTAEEIALAKKLKVKDAKAKYQPDPHRLLPQSPYAEKGTLSSMLLAPKDICALVTEKRITAEHFFIPGHALIFKSLMEMWDKNDEIDFITLTQLLRDNGKLDQCGGAAFCTELFTFLPTAANAPYYIEILEEKFALRQMIKVCTEFASRGYDDQQDVWSVLDECERKVLEICDDRTSVEIVPAKQLVVETIGKIEEMYSRRGTISGLSTGFADLDKMTDGLHGAEVTVIAARPSMGKTAIAMNIVEHLTVDLKLPVAVFSLEMSNQQLMQRMLCSGARVNLARVRDGFLSERDFPALQSAASKLAETKLYIDDASDLTIQELRGRARRLKQQHDIQAVVIDYLQLVRSNSRQAGNNREREVAEVSAGTKALAKELGLPVIVLAQLSRYDKGSRGGEAPRPRLSDLRESGCLSGETTVHYRKRNSRIDELSIDADKKGEIVCVMENKSVSSDPKLPRKTGRKPVLKLTLSTGHTIRATANHKFLSAGRIWLPLSELSAGDLIAIPLNSPTGKRATVSLAEARLLGLMTSNGCCLPRRSIQLTMNSGDSDVVRIAERDAKEVFHTIRPYHKHETPSTRPGCKWIQVFFPSKVPPSKKRRSDMAMWLERHGLWNKRAKEKQIPPAIFNQPKSVIAEFLSALFSGDGSCGIQATGSKHEYIVASYSSASKELIYGVQWLLQTLGIISGISTVKCRGFVSFTLQVYSRSNKLRFAELVGFLGSRKSKTMKSVVSAMMSAQMGWEKYIADGDLAFVPIRKIEADGIADVWDIEVPINHNFIANGIVVHNSIEQDADIVAFLTRDELYAETDEEKEAALGKATLTIAKSRNGPVGDIPLTFLKEFTLFCSRARESDDDQPTEQQTELPV